MGGFERSQDIVLGTINRGRDLALAVRAYAEIGRHYGGIFIRLLGIRRQEPVEEVKPMGLGSFRNRKQKAK